MSRVYRKTPTPANKSPRITRIFCSGLRGFFFEKQSKKEKTENFMVNFVFYDNSCLLLNLTDFQQSNRGVVDWLIS